MKIKDTLYFTNKNAPITFRPDDTVQNALDVMCNKKIGSVIVTDMNKKVCGIITERDMMIRVLGEKRDPSKTKISDIMSDNIKTANENDDLIDWLKVMSNERFRHLPVVDEEGQLINMLSQGDFVAFTHSDLDEKIRSDLKGRFGRWLQISLIIASIFTLSFIAFGM
jgi:CBS domain-containing protein